MGAKGGKEASADAGGIVCVDNLPKQLDERLQEKYDRGMRGVVCALSSALRIFVGMQREALKMHTAAISAAKEGLRDAFKEGIKEASLVACRGAVESVVVTVEMLGRDFPSSMSHRALRATARAMRDAADVLSSALKVLSAEGKTARWIGAEFCSALESFKKVLEQLPQALADLEAQIDDATPLAKHLDHTAQGELPADPWSHGIGQRHALALEHLASARQAAEASWGQPLLREGTQLRSRVKALTGEMDDILAPFIRISHNIKGKGDLARISSAALTEDELLTVQKYQSILLRNDLYERLEDNGASLEDFLEALFLLGIAAGVGMQESESRKAPGFSKKSQSLLKEALESLDADGLRFAFHEWKLVRAQLLALEKEPRFKHQEATAEEVATAYLDAAKDADRVTKELARATQQQQQLTESRRTVLCRVEREWAKEFGDVISILK